MAQLYHKIYNKFWLEYNTNLNRHQFDLWNKTKKLESLFYPSAIFYPFRGFHNASAFVCGGLLHYKT